jgi:hypothetical protein
MFAKLTDIHETCCLLISYNLDFVVVAVVVVMVVKWCGKVKMFGSYKY